MSLTSNSSKETCIALSSYFASLKLRYTLIGNNNIDLTANYQYT